MRKFLITVILGLFIVAANAQKYSISVQAGGNASFISKFDNEYVYGQRVLALPSFLDNGEGNFDKMIGIADTKTENKIGFFSDVQIERNLKNNWSISASLGVNQVAYSYETPTFGITTTDPTLNNAINKIGDVKMLYLTTRLANISKKWNRFSLTAGPELGYLLSKKYVSMVTWQTTQGETRYRSTVRDGKGDASKLLVGASLGLHYDVSSRFYARLGAQKMFSSLYKKDEAHEDVYKKSRPLQAELGLGFRITDF